MSQIATPRENILFLTNSNAIGSTPWMSVFGGDYIWSIQGTLGGTSIALEFLGQDGVTVNQLGAARTTNDAGNTPANSGTGVGIGSNSTMRVTTTGGAPSGLYVILTRIP